MFERLEEALQENGELMVRTTSGDEAELHLHNTEFLDSGMIRVDADDEIHWLDPESVERYWIHKEF